MYISGRTYILIGIGFGFFMFLLTQFFGTEIVTWLRGFSRQASQFGIIRTAILEPLILLFEANNIVSVVVATLLWPLIFVWLFLLLALALMVLGWDAVSRVQREIGFIYFNF